MPNCAQHQCDERPLCDRDPTVECGGVAGAAGRLYPDGNARPAAHDAAGRTLAQAIVPLDGTGTPNLNGLVVAVGLGFSFSDRVFTQLGQKLVGDQSVAPRFRLVDAAQFGKDAAKLADLSDDYWTQWVPAALAGAGVTREQVQVIWLMTGAQDLGATFPEHAQTLRDLVAQILRNVHTYFPNARLAFLESVHWQDYSLKAPHREPYYLEQGFAFRWVLEQQIDGTGLNYDPFTGPVESPWISWGAYLWTAGDRPRADGLAWTCPVDTAPDGSHQSVSGAAKQADRILHKLRADPACTPWFLAARASPHGAEAQAEPLGTGFPGSSGIPWLALKGLPILGGVAKALVARCAPGASGNVALGPPSPAGVPFAGGMLYVDPLQMQLVPFTADASGAATVDLADIPDDTALAGEQWAVQLVVYDPAAPHHYALSEAVLATLGD